MTPANPFHDAAAEPGESPAAPAQPAAPPEPEVFRAAVASLTSATVRSEVCVEPLRPPQRLAPYTYAIGAEAMGRDADGEPGATLATGRLVLLHDPDGEEAWDGVLRLVAFVSAELDETMGSDPMLPAVGWSWLRGALDERAAAYRAAGGTVTQTNSTRFGDIAGPRATVTLELRASWTAADADLAPHLHAFVDVLCNAAGIPPEGVSMLVPR